METAGDMGQQQLHRLWSRLLNGPAIHEDIGDLLQDQDVFSSVQVEEETVSKSRACSPAPSLYNELLNPFNEEALSDSQQCCKPLHHDGYKMQHAVPPCQAVAPQVFLQLDASTVGDFPTRYVVPAVRPNEFPVVGLYVDQRVTTGFRYRVRRITQQTNGCSQRDEWVFGGKALRLESIGRGYSRRLTFEAAPGQLNHNGHYFWSDSSPLGFAFHIEVVAPGDKFTVYDANHVPTGTLELIHNQSSQEEVSHRVLKDGSIEKTCRIRALCKLEWFQDNGASTVVPVSGLAVSVRSAKSRMAEISRIVGATVGNVAGRRGFTLVPGISSHLRSTVVRGADIGDVPTRYTVTGLESYEMPVVGTYVDPRIVPGFHYRVRAAGGKHRHLFYGRALRLVSVGAGYGKRLTFAPDPLALNRAANYLWSDTHPDGLGLEPRALHPGMRFGVVVAGLRLGEARVFRADAPQVEEKQMLVKGSDGTTVVKHIHVDVTCDVTLDTTGAGFKVSRLVEPHVMRVSGTAVVARGPRDLQSKLLRVENIGLDSQLNVLFVIQKAELVFLPM